MLDVQRALDLGALAALGIQPTPAAGGEFRKFHPDQLRVPGGEHGGEWVSSPSGAAKATAEDAAKVVGRIQSEDGLDLEISAMPGGGAVVRFPFPDDAGEQVDHVALPSSSVARLKTDLAGLETTGKAHKAKLRKAIRTVDATDEGTPEHANALDAFWAVADQSIGSGSVSGSDGSSLHWDLAAGEEDVTFTTAVKPAGAGPDWDFNNEVTDGAGGTFPLAAVAKLRLQLDKIDPGASRSHPTGGRMEPRADKPYGDVQYADPGYQKDGKARYPLDSEEHCRAAWSYINQADDAAKYTAEQLAQIKSRIKAAAKKYGIDISGNSGRAAEDLDEDRYNDFHAPAGISTGGQFTTGGGGGGGKQHGHAKAKRPAHHPSSGAHHDSGTLAYDPHSSQGTGYDSKSGDERVHALQQALNRLGVTDAAGKKLRDDGQLGPKTTSAVKRLQKLLGVKPDGKVTPALLAQIKSMKSLPAQKRSDTMSICIRSFGFEPDERSRGDGDGRTLEGYAAVFNSPTTIRDLNGDFEETILPGAFKRTLAERTPILQWDHGKDPRIGTAPIGDIEDLREDDHGLYVRARLYDHPDIERIRMAIAGRSVKGMSFRFGVPKGGDDWPTRDQRQIRDLDAYELGPVAFPAYDSTSVSVRSLLAQLDPDEHRSLIRELAAELRLAVDLSDLTGESGTRSADRGDLDLEPGSGGRSAISVESRRLEAEALRALGVL